MEIRKTIGVTRMSELIIGNLLILIILFNIFYSIIYGVIDSELNVNDWIKFTICLVVQFVLIFIACKISVSNAFINNTINLNDISKLTKNIAIALIVICVINFLYSLISVDSTVMETIESDYSYMIMSSYIKSKLPAEELKEYEAELNEQINILKKQTYIATTIVESIKIVMYLIMIPIINKSIKKGIRKGEIKICNYQ